MTIEGRYATGPLNAAVPYEPKTCAGNARMWALPILRKREGCPPQRGTGEVIHIVGYALWDRSTSPAMRVNQRSAGEGPDPIEMPHLVKALTGRLGEYEERPDRQRQERHRATGAP